MLRKNSHKKPSKDGFLKEFMIPCKCKNKIEITPDGEICDSCNSKHIDIGEIKYWETQPKGKCYDTCVKILKKHEITPKNHTFKIRIANQQGNQIADINTKEGVVYIDQQLNLGNPVIVGVDRNDEEHSYNHHKATDHFVIIVGRSCLSGKIQYKFYEVGTKISNEGVSSLNTLYIEKNLLKGSTFYNPKHKYTVTEIRKNE